MSNQRMAGQEFVKEMQAEQSKHLQKNQRILSIMDKQRQRDVAAGKGEIIPFSQADICLLYTSPSPRDA